MDKRDTKIILLADDSELFRTKTKDILKSAGYRVKLAGNGTEVIKELEDISTKAHLLVLDLQMPEIDGFNVLEWILSHNRTGNPPVLVVTSAYEVSSILEKLKQLGAAGFISKGATPEQFVFRVNNIVYGSEDVKRKNSRAPINIPVDFEVKGVTYTGYILNISETGLFIYSQKTLFTGDLINLRFSLPNSKGLIEANGKVIWVNKLAEEKSLFNGVGIHFNNITNENKGIITSYVEKELEKTR